MNDTAAGGTVATAVEAIDLRKTFDRGAVVALDGISLEIAPGEFVAVTGPSGCGKSTLLHLLAALDRPDSGSLHVGGEDVLHLEDPNRFRRETVGLVFQMHNLLPHLDALANIGIAMLGTGVDKRDRLARAEDLLRAVDMDGLGHRRPPQLSGGERQRLALARALANRPSLLLADEPTGSLDSRSTQLVLDLLARLRSEQQVTIVLVTHDDEVAAATDRIIRLRDGAVVDAGTGATAAQ